MSTSGKGRKRANNYSEFLAKSIARESAPPVEGNTTLTLSSNSGATSPSSNPIQRALRREQKSQGLSSPNAPVDYGLSIMAASTLQREAVPSTTSLDDPAILEGLTGALNATTEQLNRNIIEGDDGDNLSGEMSRLRITGEVAKKALRAVDRLKDVISETKQCLEGLAHDLSPDVIHRALNRAEQKLDYVSGRVGSITNEAASAQVTEVVKDVATLRSTLEIWKRKYPDTLSPVRINNSMSIL
ncbi:hypothetical protein C8R42DRAFT_637010 [Lentinula raphanica]|nr:hypothetical protein C8R42DRAFT_637010 [Lentinula raphanica]